MALIKSKDALKKEKHLAQGHLKTLVNNSNKSRVRTTGRIVKYGTASFARNIWLSIAATLVMTITLAILAITVFASLTLSATADAMREKIDITVYFKPGTSESILGQLKSTIEADGNVKSTTTSTSEQEYQHFLEKNNNEELKAALSEDDMAEFMIDGMPAAMRIQVVDVNNLDSIKSTVETNDLFTDNIDPDSPPSYDTDRSKIDTITSWANMAKNGGLILGAVFLAISVLVIFNTIRMAIFSRREEIYMMKLVGADNTFIRGPFLVEAQMCGVISGLLASGLIVVGYHLISAKIADYGIDITTISNILETGWLAIFILATILLGVIVGSISARLAIRKYLH